MKALRIGLVVCMIALLWPEFTRYRAQWRLAEANARIETVLSGQDRSPNTLSSVLTAVQLAKLVIEQNPNDPNAILIEGIGLIMLGQGEQAMQRFETAIAQGERPEFVLNLGRARNSTGDEAGARQAYLRAAWSS